MRRTIGTIAGVLLLALPATAAAAGGGGATAPAPGSAAPEAGRGGGAVFVAPDRRAKKKAEQKRRRARRRASGPRLRSFSIDSSRVLYGSPAQVSFAIASRARLVDVRLYVIPVGSRTPASTLRLGGRRSGRAEVSAAALAEGAYTLRIAAKDARGRRLRSAAGVSSSRAIVTLKHRFPLVGPFTYGGNGARFGAKRAGHRHQGQDLAAAEGTPIVAPRAGVVKAVGYQRRGAGHYIVIDGDGEDRDYVFMHLKAGSMLVEEDERVRTAERIGQVGNTGRSFGAHLHFEIWVGGGWYTGGKPVDPLPYLKAWEALL